jgi:hypothetical protein
MLLAFGEVRTALRKGGEPDRDEAEAVIRALRPGCAVEPIEDSTLADEVYPGHALAYVAVLPDATIVCDQELMMLPPPDHVREFAAGRPMIVFSWHSGSGVLGFGEWDADGTLLREHHAESDDQYEFAQATMHEMFGFAPEGVRGEVDASEIVVHGFKVAHPDQVERDARLDALVAEMVGQGPQRMAPDGSLVPVTESP